MGSHYRNSDFAVNQYFKRFPDDINEARKHGKDVLYNEIRKKNNCPYARKLQGDVWLREIFRDNWGDFLAMFGPRLQRDGLIDAVESFIHCHDFGNGYLFYECPVCNDFYMVGFSCHSRVCPSCGKKYRDQRTAKVSEKIIEVPHRQFVFTVPQQLRPWFRAHRKPMLNALFLAVSDAFGLLLSRKAPKACRKEKRRFGFISFLHTFGRDLKWHPHIHVLMAECYLTKDGDLRKHDFFSFDFLRLAFQNCLFSRVWAHFEARGSKEERKAVYSLLASLRKRYPKGYYVYGRKFSNEATTTKDITALANYVARYASHPAISERRIVKYDPETKTVTWFYDPHEDDDVEDEEEKMGRQYVTESALDFMARIVLHIPDKGFQQIRYYGFYSNKFKGKVEGRRLFAERELAERRKATLWANGLKRTFGYDPTICKCGAQMVLNLELSYFPGGHSP